MEQDDGLGFDLGDLSDLGMDIASISAADFDDRRDCLMGRKAFEFTPERLELIERMAGVGLNLERMAAVLGISHSLMEKKSSQNDDVNAAIQRGKGKASFIVGRALFERAREGDVPAIKWFETTRDGRSDRQQLLGDADHPLHVSVGGITDAEWAALAKLEHEVAKSGET